MRDEEPMHEDWDDEELEALGPEFDGIREGVPIPIMRAVYAHRRLTVVCGRAGLTDEGSVNGMNFDDRTAAGVSILELGETQAQDGGWDLTAGFLADGRREVAERRLLRWAGLVGYSRVWLPDRLVEPPERPPVNSTATVGCTACGHRWHGRGRRFWQMVWSERIFPNVCPLCGVTLAQWSVQTPRRVRSDKAEGNASQPHIEHRTQAARSRMGRGRESLE